MKTNIYLKSSENGKLYDSKGIYEDGKVVVFKGSRVNPNRNYTKNQMINDLLSDKNSVDNNFILKRDISFSSPSTAGLFVTGNSTNGLTRWKVGKGTLLKKFLEGGKING